LSDYADVGAVFFDLDGTLIEHTRPLDDLCRETFEAFGDKLGSITAEHFWEVFWPKNHDMWYMMVDGVLPGDVARLYSFANTLRAVGGDVGLAQAMLEDWELRIIDATRLFLDALPTMERMREADLCLGIVTNGFATMQRRKIRRHRLEKHVDFILVSEEMGVFKPEQAIFELALAQAGVAAGQALFVGDTPVSDIQGARDAGLQAALMDPCATWADIELDEVPRLQRLGELLPLLGLN
jgi:HAD superfamily hydrolase (TIGR01549 family)